VLAPEPKDFGQLLDRRGASWRANAAASDTDALQ